MNKCVKHLSYVWAAILGIMLLASISFASAEPTAKPKVDEIYKRFLRDGKSKINPCEDLIKKALASAANTCPTYKGKVLKIVSKECAAPKNDPEFFNANVKFTCEEDQSVVLDLDSAQREACQNDVSKYCADVSLRPLACLKSRALTHPVGPICKSAIGMDAAPAATSVAAKPVVKSKTAR
jgi:hypothetical protein